MTSKEFKSRPSTPTPINNSEAVKTKIAIDIFVKKFCLKVDQPMKIRLIWNKKKN